MEEALDLLEDRPLNERNEIPTVQSTGFKRLTRDEKL